MNVIDSLGRTWSKLVCPVANPITTADLTTLLTPDADAAILISDYKIWNEHASTSTAVGIFDGSTLIDAGPAGFDYRGYIDNRNAMLKLTKGNALKLQCTVNSTSVRYSFTYTFLKGAHVNIP